MKDDLDIQDLLRGYAAPVPDNGFTAATLARAEKSLAPRLRVLIAAGFIGGAIALSQTPSLWEFLTQMNVPTASPVALTALGGLGFVVWAALDRGWSNAV